MAREEQERLAGRPHPLPVFRKGATVSVYLGSGWAAGYVTDSSRDRCTVHLAKGQRSVTCNDARNIKPRSTER